MNEIRPVLPIAALALLACAACTPKVCQGVGSSSLPGVSIELPKQACSFTQQEAKRGITFKYVVRVDGNSNSTAYLPPQECRKPGPSGLVVYGSVEGNGQRFCDCDQGDCWQEPVPRRMKAGKYEGSFDWDGINWGGSSDWNAPKGKPFPAGKYEVRVRATGSKKADGSEPFVVEATMPIHLK
jgi:hypothetical protein